MSSSSFSRFGGVLGRDLLTAQFGYPCYPVGSECPVGYLLFSRQSAYQRTEGKTSHNFLVTLKLCIATIPKVWKGPVGRGLPMTQHLNMLPVSIHFATSLHFLSLKPHCGQ